MSSVLIPKIIHCCRFGPNPLSRVETQCFESWKRWLPDYEIRIWNEENVDLFHPIIAKNLKDKVYAFASDFVRLDVLNRFGGIYLDNDIEILQSLDEFLTLPCFIGIENENLVNTAIIGSKPGHPFIRRCIQELEQVGHNRNQPYLAPVLATHLLENSSKITGLSQVIDEVHIFPKHIFYPLSYEEKMQGLTPDLSHSFAIHHYSGSWKGRIKKSNIKMLYHAKLKIQERIRNWFN